MVPNGAIVRVVNQFTGATSLRSRTKFTNRRQCGSELPLAFPVGNRPKAARVQGPGANDDRRAMGRTGGRGRASQLSRRIFGWGGRGGSLRASKLKAEPEVSTSKDVVVVRIIDLRVGGGRGRCLDVRIGIRAPTAVFTVTAGRAFVNSRFCRAFRPAAPSRPGSSASLGSTQPTAPTTKPLLPGLRGKPQRPGACWDVDSSPAACASSPASGRVAASVACSTQQRTAGLGPGRLRPPGGLGWQGERL